MAVGEGRLKIGNTFLKVTTTANYPGVVGREMFYRIGPLPVGPVVYDAGTNVTCTV